MRHSIDLLTKLRDKNPQKSERALALELGYTDTALQAVKTAKRMSPEMAADMAAQVDEDPATWALIAAAEGAKNASVKRRLTALIRKIG